MILLCVFEGTVPTSPPMELPQQRKRVLVRRHQPRNNSADNYCQSKQQHCQCHTLQYFRWYSNLPYHNIPYQTVYHTIHEKKLPYHISWCTIYLRHPSRPVSRLSLTYTLERPGYQIRGNQELSCNRSWQPVTLMNPHLDHSFDQLKWSHQFLYFSFLIGFFFGTTHYENFYAFSLFMAAIPKHINWSLWS